ncbi:MAG TPA: hypothetical protein VFA77_17605 [Candidatus Eisenbacteria bacterium]|jgi:hypothetical protein|nr:hypothetical protein [Candidatus Eisenbacteria bacterium]
MAANVLNSPEAVRMSAFVVRAFVKMRELLGGTKELARQLADSEKQLTARLDGHEVAIAKCSSASWTSVSLKHSRPVRGTLRIPTAFWLGSSRAGHNAVGDRFSICDSPPSVAPTLS